MGLWRSNFRAEIALRGIQRTHVFIFENFDGEPRIRLTLDVGNAVFEPFGTRCEGIAELYRLNPECGIFHSELENHTVAGWRRDKLMRQLPFDMPGSQQLVKHTGDLIDHDATFRRLARKQPYLLTNGRGDFIVRKPGEIIERERDRGGILNLEFNGDRRSVGREVIVDR